MANIYKYNALIPFLKTWNIDECLTMSHILNSLNVITSLNFNY